MMHTPVVFLFFNRHDTTLKVFERIRMARPRQLVLVSDGPPCLRSGRRRAGFRSSP